MCLIVKNRTIQKIQMDVSNKCRIVVFSELGEEFNDAVESTIETFVHDNVWNNVRDHLYDAACRIIICKKTTLKQLEDACDKLS